MQPPQSAFFPRTRNTFPGVMIARGSDALIQEMARSMSWSEMQLQWHTIIRPVASKCSGFARSRRRKRHMPFNSRLKQSSMSGLFPLLRSCFGISCKKCATAKNRHNQHGNRFCSARGRIRQQQRVGFRRQNGGETVRIACMRSTIGQLAKTAAFAEKGCSRSGEEWTRTGALSGQVLRSAQPRNQIAEMKIARRPMFRRWDLTSRKTFSSPIHPLRAHS